jgi:hypothetical protein
MYKMYFNTGVKPENRLNASLSEHESWRNGALQIAYYLESEPPQGYTLAWLCDNPKCEDYQLAIRIVDGGILSKYAIFNKVK